MDELMQNAAFLPVAFEVVLLVGALRDAFSWLWFSTSNASTGGPIAGRNVPSRQLVWVLLQWRDVEETGGGLFFSAQNLEIAGPFSDGRDGRILRVRG